MRSSGFAAAEKSAVTAACQHLIDEFLKPRRRVSRAKEQI
jgi:hypothetical protein